MARAADVHLWCVVRPAASQGPAPTTSTTATLVMGDALAVALLKARWALPPRISLYRTRRRAGT